MITSILFFDTPSQLQQNCLIDHWQLLLENLDIGIHHDFN